MFGGRYLELALDQISSARRGRIGHRGADLLASCDPKSAVVTHEAFHGAASNRDALALHVSPHLGGPIQRLGFAAAVLVRLVEAGQHLGDHRVPQRPRRRGPRQPGVECSRGDRTAVLGEHAADRSDPEPSTLLGDERTDQRRRGSLSRAKKLVAALRISTVSSSSRFLRLSSRFSRAMSVGTPVADPGINLGLIDPPAQRLRRDTQALGDRSHAGRAGVVLLGIVGDQPHCPCLELVVVLLRHDANYLPSKEGVHQTRGGSICGDGEMDGLRLKAVHTSPDPWAGWRRGGGYW